MPLYICRRWDGDVVAREGQKLEIVGPGAPPKASRRW
jgi:hypothetical protein